MFLAKMSIGAKGIFLGPKKIFFFLILNHFLGKRKTKSPKKFWGIGLIVWENFPLWAKNFWFFLFGKIPGVFTE